MAENQEQKSRRDAFGERLKAKYPDREYADDEALFGQIDDDYADYEKQLGDYKIFQEKYDKESEIINNAFAENPRLAQLFSDIINGEDALKAFIKYYGSENIIELMNDPDKAAEYAAADAEYKKRLAEEKELAAQVEANQAETDKVIEQAKGKYGEEAVLAALDILNNGWHDAVVGIVKPETLEMAVKMITHDADVENARSEGEVAGRNAKIEEKLRKQNGGDGMPAMGGSNTIPAAPKKRGFFDDLPKRKF